MPSCSEGAIELGEAGDYQEGKLGNTKKATLLQYRPKTQQMLKNNRAKLVLYHLVSGLFHPVT